MGSFVLFGVDWVQASASINWYLVLYVIASVVSCVYGTFRLYESGGGIRSTIYGIGSAAVFVFFGYRWFSNPSAKLTNWPPVVNMCPDYLTFIPTASGERASKGGCVDMLGVKKSGTLEVSLPSDIPIMTSSSAKLFPYTAKDVSAATTAKALQVICDKCRSCGVTWEGVYDGDVCTAIKTVDAKNAALESCIASV